MADDARIRELVEHILESNRTPEEVCADDLELLPAVRQRLSQVRAVNAQLADFFPEAAATPLGSEPGQDTPTAPEAKPGLVDDALAILAPGRGPGVLGMLDHYEVLEIVGRGGMGVVYKARDTKLQRIVAIKALAPALAADGTARRRFIREAQAAAAVRDDHVVGIHAVCDDGPVAYLVMEFISGTNLAAKVKEGGPLELKEILRIGMQTAEGLAAAHKQGLIHRDIKPANILLENGVQRVKIADFGLARAVDSAHVTQSGVVVGTPLYMSPEQAREEPVDHRSDLFSLGSVLYTLCTGRPAFRANSSLGVLKRVCEDTPRPIRDANPDLPGWLVTIVNKLLAKDPKERYQSAAEVAQVMGRHLAELQQHGLTTAAKYKPELAEAKRKPYAMAAVFFGLLVFLASVVTVAILSQNQEPPTVGEDSGKSAVQEPATVKPQPAVAKPVPDPRVLTVSKNPKDEAHCSTIKEALDKVEPDMTIRILDDADYEEQVLFDNPSMQRGVVLESIGKARICFTEQRQRGNRYVICIRGVPKVTLRGLHIVTGSENSNILITGHCPATVLDGLKMTAQNLDGGDGIEFLYVVWMDEDEPIVIQNCKLRGNLHGINFLGGEFLIGRIVIKNNEFLKCRRAILLGGSICQVFVAGNKILQSSLAGLDLQDLSQGTKDVLIANNTLLSNFNTLRIWEDGDNILQGNNIRFQNNLVLDPISVGDLLFLNHAKGEFDRSNPGDLSKLLNSSEWRIGNNWREITPPTVVSKQTSWIPERPNDKLLQKIDVPRKLGQPSFLQPPRDSPLGKAGVNDGVLPAYVGAVPPEGVEPWDWNITWKALVGKKQKEPGVLTVSKNPKDEAQFRTITEALDQVRPDMTIRILDNAVYDEQINIDNPSRQRGLVLEAIGKARILYADRRPPGNQHVVSIRGVPGVTLRGFHIVSGSGNSNVFVTDQCPGTILDKLEMTATESVATTGVRILNVVLKEEEQPIVIQNCTLHGQINGINVWGGEFLIGRIVIKNNEFLKCGQAIFLGGSIFHVLVAGNRILQSSHTGVDLWDLSHGTKDVLVVNNTLLSNRLALRIWDDGDKILQGNNIRFQNNLVLDPGSQGDLVFLEHVRGVFNDSKLGDLPKLLNNRQRHIGNNWREMTRPSIFPKDISWIPECPQDRLLDKIDVPRKRGQPNFLQPPKDSPLGKAGVGDGVLPPYVGAVPPEGIESWDWNITWKALTRKS